MTAKKDFHTAKALREFIEQNSSDSNNAYIKEVYNLGDNQFYESPLFLYSGYSVIMVYLSDGILSLNVYDKDLFIPRIRGGMFRENPDSEEFYYFNFTESKLINSFVSDINISENENGTVKSICLVFKNEMKLNINNSGSVPGTMCSCISD